MLDRRYIHDLEALQVVERALSLLCGRHLLSGLTLQGEAILIQEATDIPTACTDTRHIWYAPEWMKSGDVQRAAFTLLHEWVHVVGNHYIRRGDRDPHDWNVAADYVVNHECMLIGFHIPPGCLVPPYWSHGLSVEQVYQRLREDKDYQKKKQEAGTDSLHGDLDGPPQSAKGRTDDFDQDGKRHGEIGSHFHEVFSKELRRAMVATQASNREVTGTYVKRRLESVLDMRPPWDRLILGNVLEGLGSDDYSYSPANFRLWPETLLPRYFSSKAASLLIAIDISGSVDDRVLQKLVSIAAPAINRASRVEVCTFDSKIRESRVVIRPSQITQLTYRSGPHSHTSAMEVFEKAHREKFKIVLVSTDMEIEYPNEPRPGTLWATPEEAKAARWGKQFYIKEFW